MRRQDGDEVSEWALIRSMANACYSALLANVSVSWVLLVFSCLKCSYFNRVYHIYTDLNVCGCFWIVGLLQLHEKQLLFK